MIFIVLLSCLALAAGQITLDGNCDPNLPVQPNFDIPKYIGLWYEIYRYEQISQFGGDCVTANYTLNNDTVGVYNRMVLLGFPVSISGVAEVDPAGNGGGKLLVSFPSVGSTSSPYWVLTTDYTDYALVYSCVNSGDKRRVYSWILSRSQTLSPSAVLAINQVIQSTDGLQWETFRQTNQTETACRTNN